MAKKALIQKQQKTPKFKVRAYTRCNKCGRPHSVYRKFGLCRICVREMAHAGELPGVTTSSRETTTLQVQPTRAGNHSEEGRRPKT